MNIEKNGCIYNVKENKASWALSAKSGSVEVSYNVTKADCPTLDELEKFVLENSAF